MANGGRWRRTTRRMVPSGRPQDGLADGHSVRRLGCGRPLRPPVAVAGRWLGGRPGQRTSTGVLGRPTRPRPHPTDVWTLDNPDYHPPVPCVSKVHHLGYCIRYSFDTRKEWLYMNRLHLCSLLITLMVNSFLKPSFYIDASLNCVKLYCPSIVWFPLILMVLFRLNVLEHTFLWRRDLLSSLSVPAPLWRTLGWMLHLMNGCRTSQLGRIRPWMDNNLGMDYEERIQVFDKFSLMLPHCLMTLYWTILPWLVLSLPRLS
jgi:hypothetical protein